MAKAGQTRNESNGLQRFKSRVGGGGTINAPEKKVSLEKTTRSHWEEAEKLTGNLRAHAQQKQTRVQRFGTESRKKRT